MMASCVPRACATELMKKILGGYLYIANTFSWFFCCEWE